MKAVKALLIALALMSSASASAANLGLGYSSWGTAGAAGAAGSVALLIDVSPKGTVHGIFGIGSTSPFSFAVGGLYKHTVVGTGTTGLHIGGGATFGTVGGDFNLFIAGVAGIHVPFPGVSNLRLHFDGGPAFGLVSTAGGSSTNFGIGPFSNILGATAVYMF